MKLVTPLAAIAAGMLVLGACSDDTMASDDSYRDAQEARRDAPAYPTDRTYSTDRTAPNPPLNDPLAPANPDEVTPPPPSPGSPPPPLPPT
jgi:hypothetical protein